MFDYRAAVVHITDGDTIRLLIDMGMYVRTEQAIRLLNVYAPESSTSEGRIAKVQLTKWVTDHNHGETWPLQVVTQKDKQTFNRYIGEVTCLKCHDVLNNHMRSLGYTNQGTGAPTA
jgi:hypothetical protein